MDSHKKVFRRTKIVSNAKAQFRIVFWLAAISTITSILIFFATYLKLSNLNYMITHSLLSPAEFTQTIDRETNKVFIILLVLLVTMTALFTAFGLYLTHNVTGPIYRLTEDLKKYLASGKKEKVRIKFRDGDEFQELPELINSILNN